MATERVERLISDKALQDFITLKNLARESREEFEQLIATGVELNSALGKASTFKQVSDGVKQMTANEEKLTAQLATLTAANEKLTKSYERQQKEIDGLQAKLKKGAGDNPTKSTDALTKATDKLNNSYSAEARALAEVSEQQKLVNAANRLSAQETLGLIDAYRRLELEYNAAAKEAKALAAEFGAGSEQARQASLRALELDKRLKDADASVGRFNRNVGNYSGALNVLQKALDQARAKQDAYRKSGQQNADVLEQLQKEEKLLTDLLESQAAGFTTMNAELKANTIALQQLERAGMGASAAYQELFNETASLKENLGDLKEAITNADPGELGFNAAADAARGLIGIYGLAASASAAFGLSNDALEETLVKLQAAETALQSIEAVRNLFKKESSLQIAIGLALQKAVVLQTNLETAAQSKNIIVKYAAIAAQKALNAVMALAGGPMLLVISLLALLVISLSSFGSASKQAQQDFEALNNQFEGFAALLDERIELIKNSSDVEVAELEANFASQEKIRKAQIAARKAELQEIKKFLADRGRVYQDAFALSESLTQRQRTGVELDEKDKKRLDDATKYVDAYNKMRSRSNQVETQLEVDRLANIKATTEEEAKIQQDRLTRLNNNINTEKTLNEQLASNAEKSFADRIAAQEEANRQEVDIIYRREQIAKKQPGLQPNEIANIENERSNALILARKAGNNKVIALQKEQQAREYAAQYEIARIAVEAERDAASAIVENQNKDISERGAALYTFYLRRQALIEGAKNEELRNANLTGTERLAIEKKANDELERARIEFLEKINELSIQSIEQQGQQAEAGRLRDNSRDLIALNERFAAGKISAANYAKDRARLEKAQNLEVLQLQIDNLKKLQEEYEKQGINTISIQEQIADKERQISDQLTEDKIANIEKERAAREQLGMEIAGLFTDLVAAGYEKEKNAIQGQIDELERRKQIEIDTVNATVLNEEQKADRIAVINARAAADREALERKQRQLDVQKAKFDKQVNIANIIFNTTRGIVAALTSTPPNVPLSIYVGTIGAVQLARAIATPIPAYKTGGTHAQDGLALVGDGGVSEYGVLPGGSIFKTPATPTLMNMPKGTVIYPNDQKAMEAGIFNNYNQSPVLVDKSSHYKYMTAALGSKLDKVTAAIKDQPKEKRVRTRDGWRTMKKVGNRNIDFLNRNLQG